LQFLYAFSLSQSAAKFSLILRGKNEIWKTFFTIWQHNNFEIKQCMWNYPIRLCKKQRNRLHFSRI